MKWVFGIVISDYRVCKRRVSELYEKKMIICVLLVRKCSFEKTGSHMIFEKAKYVL